MSPPQTSRSGRHRTSTPLLPALVAGVWRRPNHASALKALALSACALGVATAFAAPDALPAQLHLTSSPAHPPVEAHAAALPAPVKGAAFGVIGFNAQPAAGKGASDPTVGRNADNRVSRSIRRTGLRGELGLSQRGLVVLNAVRDNFPAIRSYGGFRAGDMDHGTGNAVDVMISGQAQGDAVAAYVMAHSGELNVKYIIWRQRIWYPTSRTWKGMEDRGGVTANHYDHVHISVK